MKHFALFVYIALIAQACFGAGCPVLTTVKYVDARMLTVYKPYEADWGRLKYLYSVKDVLFDPFSKMPLLVDLKEKVSIREMVSTAKKMDVFVMNPGHLKQLALRDNVILSENGDLQRGVWIDLQSVEIKSTFDSALGLWEDVSGIWKVENGRLMSGLATGWHDIPMIVCNEVLDGNCEIRFDVVIEALGQEIRCPTAKDITVILAGTRDANQAKTIAWASARSGGVAIYTGNAIHDIEDLAKERVGQSGKEEDGCQMSDVSGEALRSHAGRSWVRDQWASFDKREGRGHGADVGEQFATKIMGYIPLAFIPLAEMPWTKFTGRTERKISKKDTGQGGDVNISDGAKVGQRYKVKIISAGMITRFYVNDRLMVEREAEPLKGAYRLWLVTPESSVSFDNIEVTSLPETYNPANEEDKYLILGNVVRQNDFSLYLRNIYGSSIKVGDSISLFEKSGNGNNAIRLHPVGICKILKVFNSTLVAEYRQSLDLSKRIVFLHGVVNDELMFAKKELRDIHVGQLKGN